MRKTVIVTAVALAVTALTGRTYATTVDWSAQEAAVVQLDNSLVPGASLIQIGFFDISDATIQANQTDVSFLVSHFTVFDSAAVGDGFGGTAGFWTTGSGDIADAGNVFKDQAIALWVFNAPTANSATQHGIYKASNSSWIFPDDAAIVDSVTIDLIQVDNIVVGAVGPILFPGQGDVKSFQLAAIPEPTTAVLVGMSMLGVLAMRRRK